MKPTVKILLDDARDQCLECDGTRKLVASHCTGKLPTGKTCRWFKYRVYRLVRCQQMTLFTFDIFKDYCKQFLVENYSLMLSQMWWSDIRLLIEDKLNHQRIRFSPRWWSAIAQEILPPIGWYIDGVTRTSPINRARENKYSKIIKNN
jgi:hypothetical protein